MSDENQSPATEATSAVVSEASNNTSKFKRYRKFFALAGVLVFAAVGATTLTGVFAATTAINETFTTSAANFTTVVGGTWGVGAGTYKLTNPATPTVGTLGNANYAIHKTAVKGDFSESVDFTVTKTTSAYNDASVIFDWVDANNYYFASFNASADAYTNGIFKIAGGVQTQLATFSTTFPPAVLRHATVTRSGNNISVSLGTTVVGSASSTSQPTTGRLGFGSRNDTVTFDNFAVTVPGDTTPPTAPNGLKTTAVKTNSVSLSWTAATDAVGVTGYRIYRNNVQVGTSTTTSYTDTGLGANTAYSYTVAAIDAAANVSAKSAALSVTTTKLGFTHPGILINTAQINLVKNAVGAGTTPWSTFYTQMVTKAKPGLGSSKGVLYSSLSYTAHPANNYACPSGDSALAPAACNDETNDAIAAYAAALMYNYGTTNRDAYAQQSIKILNAWAAKLRTRVYNGATDTKSNNAYLQASWGGSVFAKAAELIRYTYTPPAGETALNVANLTTMFNSAYVPYVDLVWSGGGANWLMSFNEATMNIGIFENNQTLFNNAVARWKAQVPSIIYMTTDVNPYANLTGLPIPTPGTQYDKASTTATSFKAYWKNPTKYVNGLEGETCRDPAHTAMGFGAMMNIAETARIQGVDLYGLQKNRIAAGLELNTGFLKTYLGGKTPSNWVCPTAMNTKDHDGWQLTYEIAYNEFANRLGMPMPNTNALLTTYSRSSTYKSANNGMEFEGLTNYGAK